MLDHLILDRTPNAQGHGENVYAIIVRHEKKESVEDRGKGDACRERLRYALVFGEGFAEGETAVEYSEIISPSANKKRDPFKRVDLRFPSFWCILSNRLL